MPGGVDAAAAMVRREGSSARTAARRVVGRPRSCGRGVRRRGDVRGAGAHVPGRGRRLPAVRAVSGPGRRARHRRRRRVRRPHHRKPGTGTTYIDGPFDPAYSRALLEMVPRRARRGAGCRRGRTADSHRCARWRRADRSGALRRAVQHVDHLPRRRGDADHLQGLPAAARRAEPRHRAAERTRRRRVHACATGRRVRRRHVAGPGHSGVGVTGVRAGVPSGGRGCVARGTARRGARRGLPRSGARARRGDRGRAPVSRGALPHPPVRTVGPCCDHGDLASPTRDRDLGGARHRRSPRGDRDRLRTSDGGRLAAAAADPRRLPPRAGAAGPSPRLGAAGFRG